jgi:hypothetical protein
MATTMANSKNPNNDAPVNPIKNANSPANQQVHSNIMHLPQEVRDEIYANLFCYTHFTYANAIEDQREERRFNSSACETGLALLRTCRRVRDEIGVSWLHQALFTFLVPYTLLVKLADIPITVREQIRHVCVSGSDLTVVYDEDSECEYDTTQALKMLPGLQLDTLSVIGTRDWSHKFQAFYNIDSLLRHSDGWKELHFLADSPEPLDLKVAAYDVSPLGVKTDCSPRPQPSDWQETLEQRDGQASHPSVTAYLASDTAAPGAAMPVLHPCIQEAFAQAQTTDHLQQVFARDAKFFVRLEDDAAPTTREARNRYMLVVVKRGAGVDYAEKEGSPYLPYGDIREDSRGMTWKEINPPPSPLVSEFDDGWY